MVTQLDLTPVASTPATPAPAATGREPVTCGLAVGKVLTRSEAEASATLLKAVADPARLQLLSVLRNAASGEACVCDLTPTLDLSQPTVSHHLKVLTEAGLVSREKRGTWAWYRVVPERLAEVASIFG